MVSDAISSVRDEVGDDIVEVIDELMSNEAVRDTIWMSSRKSTTAVEVLIGCAFKCGKGSAVMEVLKKHGME